MFLDDRRKELIVKLIKANMQHNMQTIDKIETMLLDSVDKEISLHIGDNVLSLDEFCRSDINNYQLLMNVIVKYYDNLKNRVENSFKYLNKNK